MKGIRCGILTALLASATLGAAAEPVGGTFVQLRAADEGRTVEQWRADLDQMRAIGIRHLIVQWCAVDSVAYLQPKEKPDASDEAFHFTEHRAILEPLMAAVSNSGMTVTLGLQTDTRFWTEITASERVLRDYFLLRVAHHESLQALLLQKFSACAEWTGYYIPDEIDDLTWRNESKNRALQAYFRLLVDRIRSHDTNRTVYVSAFFRPRTAPYIFVRQLRQAVAETGIDCVLVQDGVGVHGMESMYVDVYYAALRDQWKLPGVRLGCVLEAFQQLPEDSGQFKAVPAAPARFESQVKLAAAYFPERVLFSFCDYVDPDLGEASAALFRALSPSASNAAPSTVESGSNSKP